MSLPSGPETNSISAFSKDLFNLPDAMQQFKPGQCLFCPNSSPTFDDSVIHMQKSHSLFVPNQQHLAVDLETLFRYLHLVIFGYRECIHCGTERTSVQAVQQHMASKGHCKFDISERDSEFAEFYDFSDPEDESESDIEGNRDHRNSKAAATSSNQKSLLADEDSIRLPSGKIISRQSSAQLGPLFAQLRHRTRTPPSKLEYHVVAPDEEGSIKGERGSEIPDTRLLSRREKRDRATVAYQLANMNASDRTSLMHLSASQQRSILATQHKQTEKVQKEERRKQGKIDRKGNKNLYAYWHTETPVYQCG